MAQMEMEINERLGLRRLAGVILTGRGVGGYGIHPMDTLQRAEAEEI
jgi:hypothetical protein